MEEPGEQLWEKTQQEKNVIPPSSVPQCTGLPVKCSVNTDSIWRSMRSWRASWSIEFSKRTFPSGDLDSEFWCHFTEPAFNSLGMISFLWFGQKLNYWCLLCPLVWSSPWVLLLCFGCVPSLGVEERYCFFSWQQKLLLASLWTLKPVALGTTVQARGLQPMWAEAIYANTYQPPLGFPWDCPPPPIYVHSVGRRHFIAEWPLRGRTE